MIVLREALGSQRKALAVAGVSRSTWQYRHKPRRRVENPIPQHARAYCSRIGRTDRERIEERIKLSWARLESVDQAFADAWNEGLMLASRRTWWRIAAGIEDQLLRPKVPTRRQTRQPRNAPVLKATGPGQVWSWDITDLQSPWRSVVFKAYKITDIFSRKIVGWRVESREADHLAVEMFAAAIAEHGPPQIVHADSGPAMRSTLLQDFLDDHQTTLTHNRPYVSNDNPFSESGFRTLKYRPGYPKIFTTLDTARDFIAGYVPWYNNRHAHSGIALFSPGQVHDGTWTHTWQIRDNALQAYYDAHPERFHTRPTTPTPADIVGINLPDNQKPRRKQTV